MGKELEITIWTTLLTTKQGNNATAAMSCSHAITSASRNSSGINRKAAAPTANWKQPGV
jgi:hypothetical protein